KGGESDDESELIPLSVPEIRRLMGHLGTTRHHINEHYLHWSRFRRRSQARARHSHYKHRGHNP
ncbi:IS701 family transposase, partial [Streptomyces sp. NPDC048231]